MQKDLDTLWKSSKHLIFFRAQTQYDNLGDLIINRILLDKLRTNGAIVVDIRQVPEWYCQQLELTGAERSDSYKTKFNYLIFFAALRSLVSGSSKSIYLVDSPGHRYGTLSPQQIKVYLVGILHCFIFWLVRVRICSFGVSIGPFSSTWEKLERWRSRFFDFYSVRDSISEKYAHQIGIQHVARFPDLAWLLDTPETAAPEQRDSVIFSFRAQTHNATASDEYQQDLFQTLDAIAELVCKTWSKKLIIAYQVAMDRKFCQQLAERYRSLPEVEFVEDRIDLPTMQSLYANAFMVFSNRLHVLMLAMAFGAIPIAVIDASQHSKITGIFQDADLTRLTLDIRGGADLTELTDMAEHAAAVQPELAHRYAQIREQANALFQQVMQRSG